MIKHLITRYNDGQGNEQDVKVTLYDDGLEISSLNQAKPLHLYWLASKLQRLNNISQDTLSSLTYQDSPNVRLIVDDPRFIEAISNQLIDLHLDRNHPQTKWSIWVISLAIAGLLGIITATIFWQKSDAPSIPTANDF